MEYIIDAKDRRLGRVATEAATALQDKNLPTFEPRLAGTTKVIIKNASQMSFSGRKVEQKVYYRHTGYPGGLRSRTLAEAWARDPKEVIRSAVRGMLPATRLRSDRLKRLTIEL